VFLTWSARSPACLHRLSISLVPIAVPIAIDTMTDSSPSRGRYGVEARGKAREKPLPREHHEFLGYDDPHRAALEDNPEHAEKLTLSVILSALFLGTSFTGPIIFGFILVTPILVQLSEKIGGEKIDFWIPSGWGAAAAVGFTIAGRLSDIFGRRYVILFGQLLTVVGAIISCTAKSMNQLIAGEVVLGASIGTVSVAYAGEYRKSARVRVRAS
jgi:hypothetical protein